MTIDAQLSSFMPHTVTIFPFTTLNNYAQENFSATSRSAYAYIEPNRTLDPSSQTDEERVSTTAYIADTNINIRDKITFPDGRSPQISSIQINTAVQGLEHSVVNFS